MRRAFVVLLLFSAALYFTLVGANDVGGIAGCGGFVEASPQLAKDVKSKLDLSSIKVKLTTLDGITKDYTDCAPNGYYFIPIYDKASFNLVVEGPKGWNFEPSQVTVAIDDTGNCRASTGANAKGDINFRISGFTLSGKVKAGTGCIDEPTGLSVSLVKGSEVLSQQSTKTGGAYSFTNVLPGDYLVRVSHPTWTFDKSELPVSVGWSSTELTNAFTVTGFDVRGKVLSKSDGIAGVEIILYGSGQVKCNRALPAAVASRSRSGAAPLCSAATDASGTFEFRGVGCGSFVLVPFYASAQTTFDVAPADYSFTLSGAAGHNVDKPFQVTGFSAWGRVTDHAGAALEGATLQLKLASGSPAFSREATSAVDGAVRLEGLTAGTYSIEVRKAHYHFAAPEQVKLSPNAPQISVVAARAYDMCGRVDMPGKRLITIKSASGRNERAWSNADGTWCYEAAPGEYTVSAAVSPAESNEGLTLSPATLTAVVKNSPQMGLDFASAKLIAKGRVVIVSGTPNAGELLSSSVVSLESVSGRAKQVATPQPNTGEFSFSGLAPGQYRVEVRNDRLCFQKQTQDAEVLAGGAEPNVEFVHSGYQMRVRSAHAGVTLHYTHSADQSASGSLKLERGHNSICLKRSGKYSLRYESGCMEFDDSVALSFDTASSSSEALRVTAARYRVQALLKLPAGASADTVSVLASTEGEPSTLLKPAGPVSGNTARYAFYAPAGSQVSFQVEVPAGSSWLLYPATHKVTVHASDDCKAVPSVSFEAREGVFLRGKVSPPIDGVLLRVLGKDQPNDAQPYRTVTTGADGTYSVGPLHDDIQYRVVAHKEGLQLKEDPSHAGNFQALKLAQIAVTVKDLQLGTPVSGVLLSLSGEGGYRNNNVTKANGQFSFADLFPGTYYLKPLLKEYQFDSASKTIEVAEGATQHTTLQATRVAYSCFGSVSSLNGEPEKGITVEAVGPRGEYEETQSDASGAFRIRGLLPTVTYQIRVKEQPDRVDRASPSSISHTVAKEDISGVAFVVFRKSGKVDVSGTVRCSAAEYVSGLRVELIERDSTAGDRVVRSIPAGPTDYFLFSGVPRSTKPLFVRLRTDLSATRYSYILPEAALPSSEDSNGRLHIATPLVFAPQSRAELNEIESGPVLRLLVTALLVIAAIFNKRLLPIARSVLDGSFFSRRSSSVGSNASDVDDSYTGHLKKKK